MKFSWRGKQVTLQSEDVAPLKIKDGKIRNWHNKVGLFVIHND